MLDGALSADETRFLLRRMQHDDALADCWARWQFLGDAMRGQCGRALPADFSDRVGRAIADDLAADRQIRLVSASGRRVLPRWRGGVALAASVALAAVIGGRTFFADGDNRHAVPATALATGAAPSGTVSPGHLIAPLPPSQVPDPAPVADAAAEAAAAAVIAAANTKREQRETSRSQRPRIMAASAAQVSSAAPAAQALTSVADAPTRAIPQPSTRNLDPFGPGSEISPKPWPRALLPEAASVGGLTVEYGVGPSSFHPFEPRIEAAPIQTASPPAPVEGASPQD